MAEIVEYRLRLAADGSLLGTSPTSPVRWPSPPEGEHLIYAEAVDDSNSVYKSPTYTLTVEAAGGYAPPLDGWAATRIEAAYSVSRKLRTDYTGPAIKVRRPDMTQADIGFTADGLLDTAALLTFAGTGDAFVATRYDQSGRGRHQTQTDGLAQPRIVRAGVLDVVGANNRPTAWFDGTIHRIDAVFTAVPQPLTFFGVFRSDSLKVGYFMDGIGATSVRIILGSTGTKWRFYAGTVHDNGVMDTNAHVMSAVANTTSSRHRLDGAILGAELLSAGSSSLGGIRTGAQGNGTGAFWHGPQPELVVLNGALSVTDLQTLESNQQTFYGI